jgi:putative sterol carrier protein
LLTRIIFVDTSLPGKVHQPPPGRAAGRRNDMDVTPQTIFEQKIPEAIGKNPALAKDVNAIFQFDVSGPQGGKWALDLTKEKDWVTATEVQNPAMTITVSDQDFLAIVSGKLNGQMAFMSGKIKFKPMNIALATKLSKVLAAGRG